MSKKTILGRFKSYAAAVKRDYTISEDEEFQSAYCRNHSPETAIVRIQNDILQSLDQKKGVLLVQ